MAGLWFEECTPGREIPHAIRRSVTEMDNVLFSSLTMNPQPLHIDFAAAAKTEFGRPLVNSLFTLGLVIGLSVHETTLGTIVANLGMTEVKFPHPVFHGDTIGVVSTVRSARESRSWLDAGIVEFEHVATNQDGAVVATCLRQVLLQKRPATPA